jgi:hypothetical protein
MGGSSTTATIGVFLEKTEVSASIRNFPEATEMPCDRFEQETAGAGLAGWFRGECPLALIVICSCQSPLQ